MLIDFSRSRAFYLLLGAILVLSPVISSAQSNVNDNGQVLKALSNPTIPLTVGSITIRATLANTDSTRIQGLLGWNQIGEDQGMLLDFIRPGVFAIHMQGMKFPIDALWIDSNGVIKLIYEQIQPNSGIVYPSMLQVRYCLELMSGFCKKYRIKEGQQIVFRN